MTTPMAKPSLVSDFVFFPLLFPFVTISMFDPQLDAFIYTCFFDTSVRSRFSIVQYLFLILHRLQPVRIVYVIST